MFEFDELTLVDARVIEHAATLKFVREGEEYATSGVRCSVYTVGAGDAFEARSEHRNCAYESYETGRRHEDHWEVGDLELGRSTVSFITRGWTLYRKESEFQIAIFVDDVREEMRRTV